MFYEIGEHIGRDLRPLLHTESFQILDVVCTYGLPHSIQTTGCSYEQLFLLRSLINEYIISTVDHCTTNMFPLLMMLIMHYGLTFYNV
jgi:hypothetical protein